MTNFKSINEELLTEGIEYSVGTNDGKIFSRVIYKGTKNFSGKTMMCFETQHGAQVSINPSYNSFTVEEHGQFPMPEDLNKGE
jgi:hypothetical protein